MVSTKLLLPAIISSIITAQAIAADITVSGPQSALEVTDSGAIHLTSTGEINNADPEGDGILIETDDLAISSIQLDKGSSINTGFDGIYVEASDTTIGDITVAGDITVNGTLDGGGVSLVGDSVVNGDITFTTDSSFTNSASDCHASSPATCFLGSAINLWDGFTVNGDLQTQGDITASNGILLVGAQLTTGESAEAVSVNGNIINSGTLNGALAGIGVFSGSTVTGDVRNTGTMNMVHGSGNQGNGILISSAAINYSESLDGPVGLTPGSQVNIQGSVINSGNITANFDGIALYDNVVIGGNVENSGTIDVSSVSDGDAAAIYVGDDDDEDSPLPTVQGSIINSGTLISDSTLDSDPAPIATVSINGHVSRFINQSSGTITNRDASGTAIHFDNDGIVENHGTINGTVVFSNGGTFNAVGGTSGDVIGADTLNIQLASEAINATTSSINGDLTFGGQINVDAKGIEVQTQGGSQNATIHGILNVTGSADLTGASVNVRVSGDEFIDDGATLTFLNAAGGLTSNITAVTDNSAVLSFDIEQQGDSLVTSASRAAFAEVLQLSTPNTLQLISALDTLTEQIDSGEVEEGSKLEETYNDLSALEEEELAEAIKSLEPETTGSSAIGAMSADSASAGSVNNRMASLRGAGISGAIAGESLALNGFWMQLYDGQTDLDTIGGVDGFDADTYGIAMGMDVALSTSTNVGLALSYANTDVDSKGAEDNSMDIDSYRLTAYGNYSTPTYFVDTQLSYALNRYEGTRNLFNGLKAKNEHDGDQYSLHVRGGMPMSFDNGILLTPKASLAYTYLREDSYSEKGAGNAGLHISTDNIEALVMGVGADISYPFTTASETIWIPEFHFEVQHDFIGQEAEVDSNFLGASAATFNTQGADVEQTGINTGIGLRTFGQGNLSFALRYDFLYKQDYRNQSWGAAVRYDF